MHFRTCKFKCVFTPRKRNSLDKSSQTLTGFPALLWIPLHGAEGEADLVHFHFQAAGHGEEVGSLTPEVLGEPLSGFTIPRGSGCTCEISVTDIFTPQSTHTFATEGR